MSGATSNDPVSNRSVGVVTSVGVWAVEVVVVMRSPLSLASSGNSSAVRQASAPGRTPERRIRENPGPCRERPCHDDPVTRTDPRGLRSLAPLLLVSLVVVMVALGLTRGVWLANLHNALLALTLTVVGAYVLFQRPGHREGLLFLSAGVVEGVMFLGRQVGHSA